MSDDDLDIPELTQADFDRMITREQRQRLIRGDWKPGDLKALRTLLGITQDEFARRIGSSRDTVQNWEQGRRQPRGPAIALLRLIAKHPRLALHDLAQA